MSKGESYWRLGVQIHQWVRAKGKLESHQIGLANNVHVAQRIVDALNAQESTRARLGKAKGTA